MGIALLQEGCHLEKLIISCPECQKKYAVNPQKIRTQEPEFLCRNCLTRFAFRFSLANIGKPIVTFKLNNAQGHAEKSFAATLAAVSPDSQEIKSCPKCGAHQHHSQTECYSCGIIFEKINKTSSPEEEKTRKQEDSLNQELQNLWYGILEDYENKQKHEHFVKFCRENGKLQWALEKYQKILNALPQDLIALEMRQKISGTVQASIQVQLEQTRTPMNTYLMILMTLLILSGIAMISVGLSLPGLRNLVGFGTALCVLTLGVIYVERRLV